MRLHLAALAVCLALPAYAQPRCAPRDVQTALLSDKFGESVIAMGLSDQGVVEYWANSATGTWTVTITTPDGQLCGIIAGLSFEAMPARIPGVDG